MIESIADLITAIQFREAAIIKDFGFVNHGPMIGDMYEGLTKSLISKGLFAGLDLRVVDGKVRWPDGRLSGQIDCLVVVGEGQQLPHTNHWVYPSDRVIMAVSVKKNFYGSDLAEAHANLLTVTGSDEHWEEQEANSARAAFRSVCGHHLSGSIDDMSLQKQHILGNLVADIRSPLRVVMGYTGFATERSLRNGFLDYIEKANGYGFGPTWLPNLVLCGEHCLIRLNGMPYSYPLKDSPPHYDDMIDGPFGVERPTSEEWWPLLASTSGRNSRLLLEVLWTRLAMRFGLHSQIFGEDLAIERLTLLLFGKVARAGDRLGWCYIASDDYTEEQLQRNRGDIPWTPVEITPEQAGFLLAMDRQGGFPIDTDSSVRGAAADEGKTIEEFIENWLATGLVYLDESRVLKYLTDSCAFCWLPDGRIVAGEDSTGRLSRWSEREFEKIMEAKKNAE